MAEGRPFWVDDGWKESKLPPIQGQATASDVYSAIPRFVPVETENLVGEYTTKDGLLLYHFYHKKRKEIFDQAESEMDAARKSGGNPHVVAAKQQEIAARANSAMSAVPWWPEFEDVLKSVFSEHFKFHPFKANYYPEVDGWSVAMPEPSSPAATNPKYLAEPFFLVEAKLLSKS